VRKLKQDIWQHLEAELPIATNLFTPTKAKSKNDKHEENVNPNISRSLPQVDDKKSVTFKDLMNEVNAKQSQKEASCSFYFICLLHLANEKVSKKKTYFH
jgi:chromatin segregation and condensation protein Rec8/ScpA/Scc1 (kleisin family)